MMAGATIIKQVLIERGMNIKELAEKLDIKHQSMRNKLHRDNFSFEEMITIMAMLDCDIQIVTRDTNKKFG
jgi:DNA-binding Xre family transcriptional regulator